MEGSLVRVMTRRLTRELTRGLTRKLTRGLTRTKQGADSSFGEVWADLGLTCTHCSTQLIHQRVASRMES